MGFDKQAEKVLERYKEAAKPFGEGSPLKRSIPKDYPYSPKALKPLSKALFSASVALGHTLAAHRHFSRVKSPSVSPDGYIGGKGYALSVDDIRRKLWEASESLSRVSDALHDEISAPHWKPQLSQLSDNEQEDVNRFIEEAQEVLSDPGAGAEEGIRQIEEENDDPGEGSEIPGREASSSMPTFESLAQESGIIGFSGDDLVLMSGTDCLEGGPRVDDRSPGEGDGPFGSFNPMSDATEDEWGLDEGSHPDGADYDNSLRFSVDSWAASVLPSDSETPTDSYDFGLGYGARGDAIKNQGVWGPHSGLPGTPSQSVGDTTPAIDSALNERRARNSLLPGDNADSVARADYYDGDKGNLVRGESAPDEHDLGLVDTGYVYEDLSTEWLPSGKATLDR